MSARYYHNLIMDDAMAMEQGGSIYYYHKDGLGSITDITDASGNIVGSYTYKSFGEGYALSGGLVQPYMYTGREYDPESGLYYYRARYYDPKEGRFLTKDPIGFLGGDVNLYRYVRNNPINRIDPMGLQECCSGSKSGSYWNCVNECVNKWMIDPINYAYGLLAAGFVYGVGSAPVVGGALTAGQYGGAFAGGYLGALLGGASSVTEVTPWIAAGASVGGGIVTGAGILGAFGAGYAIGTVGQCMVTCGIDPCSY